MSSQALHRRETQASRRRESAPLDGSRASWGFNEGDPIAPERTAIRLLGGGERYEAYLAWDDQLLSLVVVKVLRPSHVDDAHARAGLMAEAGMLRRLRHPVIVRSFAAAPDAARPHVVLEYVDGPRLSTLLRTSPMALDQTLSLGLQLSSAAHYMSARGVVHLDIKPQNIIMAAPARLIDLSVARRTEELAGVSSPIGTTKFMAPEQCDSSRFSELGPAADVWGIGVTLYWTLANGSPFPPSVDDKDAPLDRLFPQLVHAPAPLPKGTPPALAGLIEAMLDPRPEGRPTARAVLGELEPMVAALPRPRLARFRVPRKK
jgi:eukaryotic-like serine/threonine-protein kinase